MLIPIGFSVTSKSVFILVSEIVPPVPTGDTVVERKFPIRSVLSNIKTRISTFIPE